MDKIKIIKTFVFFMTAGIVFLLCLGTYKILQNKTSKGYNSAFILSENEQVQNILATKRDLIITTSQDRIFVIDPQTGRQKGKIDILRGARHGQKEK